MIFRLKTKTMRAEQGPRHGFGITWNAGRNKTRKKNVAASNGKSTKPPEASAITKKNWIESKLLKQEKDSETPNDTTLPFSDQLAMNFSHSIPFYSKDKNSMK